MDPYERAPTIHPIQYFDSVQDAEILKAAFVGFGSDKDTIIDILVKRSNEQRQQIAKEFKTMFGQDLLKELKKELHGHFEDVILALMTEPIQYQAGQLHKAISGLGTDESTIVEILSIHTNHEVKQIIEAYEEHYKHSLEHHIKSDTSGEVKHLLVSLATANRDESPQNGRILDELEVAFEDAQRLLTAGELIAGTEESVFNEVLCQRSRPYLRLMFEEYERITGHSFEQAIENEFFGTTKHILLHLVHCIRDRNDFLATRLYHSMKGIGTNDKTLIRIIVSRSEIDLARIMEVFQQKYEKTLADFIEDEVSGHYKKCLLTILSP